MCTAFVTWQSKKTGHNVRVKFFMSYLNMLLIYVENGSTGSKHFEKHRMLAKRQFGHCLLCTRLNDIDILPSYRLFNFHICLCNYNI